SRRTRRSDEVLCSLRQTGQRSDSLTGQPHTTLTSISYFPTPNMALPQHTIEILRFNTCGSVDDGKSTLIGRLLYDSKNLMEDQVAALEKPAGITGGRP